MQFIREEIEIDKDEPFANDKLDRKNLALNLTKLIQNTEGSLSIFVNGKYGVGKTTFLKMWLKSLKESNIKSTYISVWENDFQQKAIPVLISEISSLFPKTRTIKRIISKVGIDLVKNSIPSFVKFSSSIFFDLPMGSKDLFSESLTNFAKNELESCRNMTESISKFKEEIRKTIEKGGDNFKLIIVIDELDRCRPNYALEYLECVKHIFSIKNIFFIFGVDYFQLSESVKKVYGNNCEVDGYLRKFFDFQIDLPCNIDKSFYNESDFYNEVLKFDIQRQNYAELKNSAKHIISRVFCLVDLFMLTARDVQRLSLHLSILFRVFEPNDMIYPGPLSFLIVCKMFFPLKYELIVENKLSMVQALGWLIEIGASKKFFSWDSADGLDIFAVFVKLSHKEEELESVCESIYDSFKKKFEDLGKTKWLDYLIEQIRFPEKIHFKYGSIKYLISKLAFSNTILT